MAHKSGGASNLLVNATDHYKEGRFEEAISTFLYAIQKSPDSEKVLKLFYSVCLKKMKDPRLSSSAMSKIFRKVGSYGKSLTQAQGAFAAHRFEQAMQAAARGMWEDPTNVQGLEIYGKAAAEAGYFNAACYVLETAHKLSPKDVGLMKNLVRVMRAAKRLEEGAQYANELASLVPLDEEAVKFASDLAAESTIEKGMYDEKGDFHKSLLEADEQYRLHEELKIARTPEEVEANIVRVKERIRAEPNRISLYMHIGDLYRRLGKFNSARMAYQKGLEKDPNNFEFQARLADTQRDLVDLKAEQLRAQLEKEGENSALAGEIEALEKESAGLALAESQRRVEMHPTDMSLRLDYGRILARGGDLNEAIKQFQLARRDARCQRQAVVELGHCYEAKGMFDMAARQYKEALDRLEIMTEEKKQIMYEYARALEKMGQIEQAHGYYKTLYEEDIAFKDVAHRVETYYAQKAGSRSSPADEREKEEDN